MKSLRQILGAQARKAVRALLLCTLAVAGPVLATSEPRHPVQISYLGNAGYQISDGKVVILVDPNLSQFRKNAPSEQMTEDDSLAQPDPESIEAHINKVDYILITHAHDDHMLDAPYIAKKTGATIIGTESAANIDRAWGVGEVFDPHHVAFKQIKTQPLIVVRGGEDFQFEAFSLEVIPSL